MGIKGFGFLLGLALSASAFATQGTNLIGVSAASQALGGTGVANYTNATDALHKNPAFLVEPTAQDGRVIAELNVSYFNNNASSDVGAGSVDSQAKSKVIPSLSALYQMNERLAVALGVHTIGGAIADYTGQANHTELKIEKTLMRILPSAAYRFSDEFSVGFSPVIMVGGFALNHGTLPTGPANRRPQHWDVGLGFQLGAAARLIDSLTLGISYTLKTKMEYNDVVNVEAFGPNFATNPGLDKITIEQPQEIAAGVAYSFFPEFKVTFDYRNIAWANAEGFRQFGWENQNVFALGAQYSLKKVAIRAGFNYAKSPIPSVSGETGQGVVDLQGHPIFNMSVSRLDLILFPGITESHFTAGVGFDVTDDMTADLAFVYAPTVTRTRAGTAVPLGVSAYTVTANVSQWVAAAGIGYKF